MTKLTEFETDASFLEAEWVITIQTPAGGLDGLLTALGENLPLKQGHYSHCAYVRHGGRCRFKSEDGAHGGAEDTIQEVDSAEVIISIPQDLEILRTALDVIERHHVQEEPTVRIASEFGLRSHYRSDASNPNKYWNRSDRDALHGDAVATVT